MDRSQLIGQSHRSLRLPIAAHFCRVVSAVLSISRLDVLRPSLSHYPFTAPMPAPVMFLSQAYGSMAGMNDVSIYQSQ